MPRWFRRALSIKLVRDLATYGVSISSVVSENVPRFDSVKLAQFMEENGIYCQRITYLLQQANAHAEQFVLEKMNTLPRRRERSTSCKRRCKASLSRRSLVDLYTYSAHVCNIISILHTWSSHNLLRLFSTWRNFPRVAQFFFVCDSQAELIKKRKRKITLRAENSALWKTAGIYSFQS